MHVCAHGHICMCMHGHGGGRGTHPMLQCSKSEDNLMVLVLPFHNVSPGDQTQVTRFIGQHLYLLSYLEGP